MDENPVNAMTYLGEMRRYPNGFELWPGDAFVCRTLPPDSAVNCWRVLVPYQTSKQVICVYDDEDSLLRDWRILV